MKFNNLFKVTQIASGRAGFVHTSVTKRQCVNHCVKLMGPWDRGEG